MIMIRSKRRDNKKMHDSYSCTNNNSPHSHSLHIKNRVRFTITDYYSIYNTNKGRRSTSVSRTYNLRVSSTSVISSIGYKWRVC